MSKPLAETVPAELRAELARRDISNAELARRMEVSEMWVHRRLRGKSQITLADLERLATELQMDPSNLLARAA